MSTYRVRAERSGRWWSITFPDVPFVYSQARRLDQVETAARDALALRFDVAPDSFDIKVDIDLPADVAEFVAQAAKERREAELMVRSAQFVLWHAAKTLDRLGFTVRDAGQIRGVSPQRVSQVLATHHQTWDSVEEAERALAAERDAAAPVELSPPREPVPAPESSTAHRPRAHVATPIRARSQPR